MALHADACYKALAAKDRRFDGLFFVGVASTGVYCRCVCTARTPKRENCAFFTTAAAAEQAGFRPCLLCRPEVAPRHSRVNAVEGLASAAVRLIEDGALDAMDVPELAAELGVTDRHLRRAVVEQFGVSPVQLAQTQRLLTAKRLLMDTRLSVGEVALASGFSSLRRFNALFQARYRLNPTELRRRKAPVPPGSVVCELGYRPPYDWESILAFLGDRAVAGVEAVIDGRYVRTIRIGERRGWIAVGQASEKSALRVEVSPDLAPILPRILRRVRRLFDTDADPAAIAEDLGELTAEYPGLRVPGTFDGAELATRAILGQQISVRNAHVIAGRLAQALGEPVETPFPSVNLTFPSAARLAGASPEEIGQVGVIRTRTAAIIAVANAVETKELRLRPGLDPQATRARLLAIPGIGEWTAQYILMRALSYPDAFPSSDAALLKALGTDSPAYALTLAEKWRPWRSYAVMHLWHSLKQP